MSPKPAPKFHDPEIGESDLRHALDVIARDSVRPICGGLAFVYVVVGIAHALLMPRAATVMLTGSVSVLIAVLIALYIFLGRVTVPPVWGNRLIVLVTMMLSVFSQIRLAAVPDLPNTLSEPLLVVGTACFLLSRNWLLFIVFAVNGGWFLTAHLVHADIHWRNDLTPLLGGAMLGILIHAVRYRFVSQMERIRLTDQFIRKELELAKIAAEEARESAEAANQAKTSFLARMSHELRTPLNAIIGYSEMLEEEAVELNEDGLTDDLRKIRSAGKHLLDLINEVLDLSKIEAGRMDLYLETFQVRGLVEDAVHAVEPQLEKNQNRIELHFDDEVKSMHADLTKVRQCLINLLSNACKFTEHGLVQLDVRHEKHRGRDFIIFDVTDSGIGISPENLDRIFEPFSQADASTTRKYGGTGLGLVISQKFCRMMGGNLEVESEVGEGSTFRIRLPAEVKSAEASTSKHLSNQPTSPSKRRSRRTSAASRGTVLIVDDDPAVQELVEWNLDREGFRVEHCSRGEDALTIARQIKPSIILLDVKLPGIDGWDVLRALRNDPALQRVPVLIVSILDERAKSIEMGARGFIAKPIDRESLVSHVNRLNPRHAASV